MSAAAGEQAVHGAMKKPARNRKTDGHDYTTGQATLSPAGGHGHSAVAQPGSRNSALKEAPPKPGDGVDPNHPARATDVVIVDRAAGLVTGTRRKFAVCGFASSSRGMIPVHDPTWEIWGLNQLYRHIARADRWFDIHYYWDSEVVPGTEGDGPGSYRAWLAGSGVPVYMHHLVDGQPTSVRYPIEQVIAHHEADYFTSTIAFMLALAVMEIDRRVDAEVAARLRRMRKADIEALPGGVRGLAKSVYGTYAIGVFGVDLIVGTEYFHEKPCAEYWLGAASTRGIQVALPPPSALCKQRFRYGYEKEPDLIVKLSEIETQAAEMQKEIDECVKKYDFLNGAKQNNEYWRQVIELRLRGLGQ